MVSANHASSNSAKESALQKIFIHTYFIGSSSRGFQSQWCNKIKNARKELLSETKKLRGKENETRSSKCWLNRYLRAMITVARHLLAWLPQVRK